MLQCHFGVSTSQILGSVIAPNADSEEHSWSCILPCSSVTWQWTDEIQGAALVIASSMNKSSSYPFLQSAIKRTKVSSQRVVVVLRIRSLFSQVVDRRRIVVSSWSSSPTHNATSNPDDPG